MAVHKLEDGRWIVQYRDRETGKIKREYFGRGIEAERAAWDRQESLGLHPYKRRERGTLQRRFKELAMAYIEAKKGKIEESSIKSTMSRLEGTVLKELGGISAYHLTHYRMDQYVNRRLKAGLKRTSVHREISDIQAILNWAVSERHLLRNPLVGYKKPKRDDEVIIPPTKEEAKKLFKNAPMQLRRAMALSFYTGLRPGRKELFSLKWAQVDWDQNAIWIISARKGGSKKRLVPIHKHFMATLETWFRMDQGRSDYIISYRGRPITTIKRSFNTAKKKAGITRKLPPYALRHAFATNVLGAGGDLKSTSEILGHSRPDTTTRVYQHTDLTLHRKAVNLMPKLDFSPDDEDS